jgi:anion-transporting  ArsA/GET3 family ATPase
VTEPFVAQRGGGERGGRGDIGELLRLAPLIVAVGPGGVGKTTMSAALGVAAARAGRRVLVLTIDPARRLADALGLPTLDDTAREVPAHVLGEDARGTLAAAMVEAKASMDRLVARVARDPAMRDMLLDNRVYRAMAGTLARSHAYVATMRLHDELASGRWDLVVLDTPPARNALDILDAPSFLLRFLDEGVVGWLVERRSTGIASRLLAAGGKVAKRLLATVLGDSFLQETVQFFTAFASMTEGFRERSQSIEATLRAPSTAYVLITSSAPERVDDAAHMRHDLQVRGIEIAGLVFNQAYVPLRALDEGEVVTELSELEPAGARAEAAQLESPDARSPAPTSAIEATARLLVQARALRAAAAAGNAGAERSIAGLVAEVPPGCAIVRVPRLDADVQDVGGLRRLAPYLLGEPTAVAVAAPQAAAREST